MNVENVYFLWAVIAFQSLVILWMVITKILSFFKRTLKNIFWSFLISTGIVGAGSQQIDLQKFYDKQIEKKAETTNKEHKKPEMKVKKD